MNKEKDFHFNTENVNSHPVYKDNYTECTVLLAACKLLSLTDLECRKTQVQLSCKRLVNLNSI